MNGTPSEGGEKRETDREAGKAKSGIPLMNSQRRAFLDILLRYSLRRPDRRRKGRCPVAPSL